MAQYPATSMATQTNDAIAVTGGTLAGISSLATTTAPATTDATGAVAGNANAKLYILSTAITANSTTTTVTAGSLGITTNGTGIGKLFYADGTKWQFMAVS